MHTQTADHGKLFIKLAVFCASGFIIVPLTFRDGARPPHVKCPSDPADEAAYSAAASHHSTEVSSYPSLALPEALRPELSAGRSSSGAAYPAVSPLNTHIVGTWIADEETVSRLQSRGVLSPSMIGVPQLVLTADYRFQLSQSPFLDDRRSSPSALFSGGIWSKHREDGRWKLRLNNSDADLAVELLGAQHPYRLRLWFVHNSTAQSMTFRKFSEQVPWIPTPPPPPAPKVR